MNNEASTESPFANGDAGVIKPWLSGGMVVALLGNLILSGVLILKLGQFDETKRQALEAEAGIATTRTAVSSLQVEVNSLTIKKDALEPTIVDWEKRLKERAVADASLATLEAKQQQMEADISQVEKRLEDSSKNLASVKKQKSDIDSEVEKLKAESLSLTKTNTDTKATLALAMEAERRTNEAQNALTNAEARRKQTETDAAAAQARFDQLQKEADGLREERVKLDSETAALRQQTKTLKEELATAQVQTADLKARQASVQLEEQKLIKLQQQVTSSDALLSEQEEKKRKAAAELAQITSRLEQLRKDATDLELRRDTAKTDFQKGDDDLSAARKLLQEASAKQGELVRDSSRLEAQIEGLKNMKDALEKGVGRLEGQKANQPKGEQ